MPQAGVCRTGEILTVIREPLRESLTVNLAPFTGRRPTRSREELTLAGFTSWSVARQPLPMTRCWPRTGRVPLAMRVSFTVSFFDQPIAMTLPTTFGERRVGPPP